MLKTKVISKKQTRLEIERQSGLPEALYILKNNKKTFADINNNFLEVLGSILTYHRARNQSLCQKNGKVSPLNDNLTFSRSYTSSKTIKIHSQV